VQKIAPVKGTSWALNIRYFLHRHPIVETDSAAMEKMLLIVLKIVRLSVVTAYAGWEKTMETVLGIAPNLAGTVLVNGEKILFLVRKIAAVFVETDYANPKNGRKIVRSTV